MLASPSTDQHRLKSEVGQSERFRFRSQNRILKQVAKKKAELCHRRKKNHPVLKALMEQACNNLHLKASKHSDSMKENG